MTTSISQLIHRYQKIVQELERFNEENVLSDRRSLSQQIIVYNRVIDDLKILNTNQERSE